jgi:hypothetical protein
MNASLFVALCIVLATMGTAGADERRWTSRDYVDLYFRHYNGHVPLPHLRDEAQKTLFSHLVDPANITRIVEAPNSKDEKLRQLRIILAVLGAYRAAYNVAVIVGEPLEQELTLVQVHTLEVADAVARLTQKPASDIGAPSAWATLVEGVIESVADSARYAPAQRTIMADAVTRHYPAIAEVLPENELQRLRSEVLKLTDVSSDGRLHEVLKQMKQVIAAAP